jgi:hypothetical protein
MPLIDHRGRVVVRPPKDVLDVCAEIEAKPDETVYAAGEIVALRKLVKQAQRLISAGTTDADIWHSEARRRLNTRNR